MGVLGAEDLADIMATRLIDVRKSAIEGAGDGLFALTAVSRGKVVFEAEPKLFVTSRGEYASKLWNLTAQALARNVGRAWFSPRSTETLKADVRWSGADELQARALMARYDVTYDRVVVAYNALKCVGEETTNGARGLWVATAFVNHACAPNVKVYDIGYDGLKRVVALRDIAPLEELTVSYFNLASEAPVSAAERHAVSLCRFGFACGCVDCVQGSPKPVVCTKEDFNSAHGRALDALPTPEWPHQRVGMLNGKDGFNFVTMLSTDATHEPVVYCIEAGYSRVVCFPQLKKLLIETVRVGHAHSPRLKALSSEVQARAFAGALENEPGVLNCNACGQKTAHSKICSGCKRAFFCSQACFETQWKRGGHKYLCKLVCDL